MLIASCFRYYNTAITLRRLASIVLNAKISALRPRNRIIRTGGLPTLDNTHFSSRKCLKSGLFAPVKTLDMVCIEGHPPKEG